ncbi:hypothetical protein PR001_g29463 [Phytophthora rubi]|uniref:Secreted protein n=1 Tax=Phytophthora rubi TaxID=129364 RepID=A0A6A3H246_9STRA|nr:hypothetical protein PR001_g29463 [Phytophthora rubi]
MVTLGQHLLGACTVWVGSTVCEPHTVRRATCTTRVQYQKQLVRYYKTRWWTMHQLQITYHVLG